MKYANVVVALIATVLAFAGVNTSAESLVVASKKAKEETTIIRPVSVQELYFFDPVSEFRVPLPIRTMLLVKFADSWASRTDAEKEEYLKQYNALTTESIVAIYPRAEFILGYLSTTDTPAMVNTIKKMMEDQNLDVAPVVLTDGMNAVVDGIYIETVTPLSRDTVLAGITRTFGTDAMVHEIVPVTDERGVLLWHVSFKKLFFLGDKKLPVHALSVANILDRGDRKPSWVRHAFPKFAYLSDPVVASIDVAPVSGTVGESRVVTLTVMVYGKSEQDVVIDEREIPTFHHDKKFSIVAGGRPPLQGFFDNDTSPSERGARKQVGPNSWTIVHRYYFNLFAPELEWNISGVEIPYLYKGKRLIARVPTTTFFVRPHLDERYQLTDIPGAYLFPHGATPDAPPQPLGRSASWYQPLASAVGGVGRLQATLVTLIVALTVTLVAFGAVIGKRIVAFRASRTTATAVWSDEVLARELSRSVESDDPRSALAQVHDVFSTMLHQHFSEISPRNSTYQQWKSIANEERYRHLMARVQNADVEELFDELEMRNDANYSESDEVALCEHREKVIKLVRALGNQLRGNVETTHEHAYYPVGH